MPVNPVKPAGTPIDRPIIISGGSPLTIQQEGGALQLVDDRTLVPDSPDATVTSVKVTSDGAQVQSLPFARKQCGIGFVYGDIHLAFQTDPQGRNLRIVALGDTNFRKHFRHKAGCFKSVAGGPELAFRDLCIRRGAVPHRVAPALGHTEIKIHYVYCGVR